LEDLAEVAPDWLLSWVPETWFKRYEGRMASRRWPKREQDRRRLSAQIGRDGVHLLRALEDAQGTAAVRELESVQVWPQSSQERAGQVYWRDGPAEGAQQTMVSPSDVDARLAQKRATACEMVASTPERQAVRRQSRYRGLPKVQVQEVVTATALNCLRLSAYVHGVPRGTTWLSHLARLKREQHQWAAGGTRLAVEVGLAFASRV